MHTHLCELLVQKEVSHDILAMFDKTRKSTMTELHAEEMTKRQLHDSQIVMKACDLQSKQSLKQIEHSRQNSLQLENAHVILKTAEKKQIETDNADLIKMWEEEAIDMRTRPGKPDPTRT